MGPGHGPGFGADGAGTGGVVEVGGSVVGASVDGASAAAGWSEVEGSSVVGAAATASADTPVASASEEVASRSLACSEAAPSGRDVTTARSTASTVSVATRVKRREVYGVDGGNRRRGNPDTGQEVYNPTASGYRSAPG